MFGAGSFVCLILYDSFETIVSLTIASLKNVELCLARHVLLIFISYGFTLLDGLVLYLPIALLPVLDSSLVPFYMPCFHNEFMAKDTNIPKLTI